MPGFVGLVAPATTMLLLVAATGASAIEGTLAFRAVSTLNDSAGVDCMDGKNDDPRCTCAVPGADREDACRTETHDEAASMRRTTMQKVRVRQQNVSARLATVRTGAGGLRISGFYPMIAHAWGEEALGEHVYDYAASSYGVLAAYQDAPWASRLGYYINLETGWGSRDTILKYGNTDDGKRNSEIGFEFNDIGGTVGGDYRFTDTFAAGLVAGVTHTDVDFARQRLLPRGEPSVPNGQREKGRRFGSAQEEEVSIALYSSLFDGPWWVDTLVGYSYHDYSMTRRILIDGIPEPEDMSFAEFEAVDARAKGDTEGNEVTAGAGFGYDFSFGAWSVGPRARVDYTRLWIDGYTEKKAGDFNLKVASQDPDSLTTNLGGEVAYAISTSHGIVLPYVRADWEHEYLLDAEIIDAKWAVDGESFDDVVTTEAADRDFANFGGGIAFTMLGGGSAFIDVEADAFHDQLETMNVSWGWRADF